MQRLLMLTIVACVPLAGCDPGFISSNVQVWVRVDDDDKALLAAQVGTSAMSPSVEPPEPGQLSTDLITELGLGRPVSAAHVVDGDLILSDPLGVDFVPARSQGPSQGRSSFTVDLGELTESLRARGVSDEAHVFVSVCNSAGKGGASGRSVVIKWADSCGVLDTRLKAISPDAQVSLRPAGRNVSDRIAPSASTKALVALAALAGIGIGLLSPGQKRGRKIAGLMLAAVAICSGFAALGFFDLMFSHWWTEVGQYVGTPARPWFLFLLSLFIGGVALFGGLAQQARTVDARNASRR